MARYNGLMDGTKGNYGVVIPDLPGCTAMGRTIDEAIRNADFSLVSKQRLAIVQRELFEQLDQLAIG